MYGAAYYNKKLPETVFNRLVHAAAQLVKHGIFCVLAISCLDRPSSFSPKRISMTCPPPIKIESAFIYYVYVLNVKVLYRVIPRNT